MEASRIILNHLDHLLSNFPGLSEASHSSYLRLYKRLCNIWGTIVQIRPPSFLTPAVSSGVSKTIFKFDNLLKGFTYLTKSCYTYGYSLSQGKDTAWNQPKEEIHMAESKKMWNSQLSSPHGVKTARHQCVTIHMEQCQTGNSFKP